MKRQTVSTDDDTALRRIRIERGHTLSSLATETGVSKGYLSALETDRKANPSLFVVRRIAAVLGTTIDAIFPDEDQP